MEKKPTYEELEKQLAESVSSRLAESQQRESYQRQYLNLFENVNISIWNEDLSEVFDALGQLREEGVVDLKKHLTEQPQIAWALATKVKVLHVNQATLKLFESPAEGVLLNQISNVFGSDAIEVLIEELCAIWNKEEFFSSEANFLTLNGREIKTIVSLKIPDDREGFKNIPIIIQDITELDYQKDQLNAIVEALPDITFIIDEDGKYIEILTSRDELLFDKLQNLKGNLIRDVLPEKHADLFLATIAKALKTDQKQIVEYELEVAQGNTWFEGRIAPMHNRINNKQAVVWLAIDITEHKQIETQFRQSQKMEAIGILTGGIAHEFNNLLAPILGYAELFLDNKSEDDPDYRGLNQIFIAGNRAKVLVQQLLAYGRQSMSQREPVQIETVVTEALNLIRNTFPSNITIKKQIQTELPLIYAMPNEVHQIIINLLVNARHAMPDGGKLLVNIKEKQPNQPAAGKSSDPVSGYICLTVHDTGEGIEPASLERIFDPFFTTKDIGQGSGLGLSVVQGIVEQHNGVIEVESELGKGASFHVFFPIADVDTEPQHAITSPLQKGDGNVLVIDDERMILDLAEKMLSKLNYNVTTCISCKKGLKILTESP
ncbi:MAG: hypothetical protein DRQ47_06170, partial [Gammaproteobacteria bacterium]